MNDNTSIPNKRWGADNETGEGVIEFSRVAAAGQLVPNLAGEVADLAGGEVGGVAGGLLARVVGVEVCAGGGAEAGCVDGVFVDVEGWGCVS